MALEPISAPSQQADAGMFNLPPAFDVRKHAAEWVLEDQVPFKQQRQVLQGTGMSADGWAVWKAESRDKPTVVIGSGNKRFVLMCRPREIQNQVNAAFGNVSKKAINREVKGESVAGEARQDPGILTEKQLTGDGASLAAESIQPLNEVETVSAAQHT